MTLPRFAGKIEGENLDPLVEAIEDSIDLIEYKLKRMEENIKILFDDLGKRVREIEIKG